MPNGSKRKAGRNSDMGAEEPSRMGRVLLLAAVALVGLNLRPFITGIGPLAPDIGADTGLGLKGISLLTLVPMLLMGVSSIQRFDVERGTLLSMVGQGFGITIFGAATSLLQTSGVVFVPFADEPEPVPFSAVWSPYNRSAALRNLLDLASKMGRSIRVE